MGSNAAKSRVLPVIPTARSSVEKDLGVPETSTAKGTLGPGALLTGPHGSTGGRAAAAGGAPGDAGRVRGGVGAGRSGRYLRGRGLTWSGALKRAGSRRGARWRRGHVRVALRALPAPPPSAAARRRPGSAVLPTGAAPRIAPVSR